MSMRKLKSLKVRPSLLVPVAAGLLVAGFAIAWSGPPGSPPTCPSGSTGCSAPVDTSATTQVKAGKLILQASLTGDSMLYGNNTSTGANSYGVRGASSGSWAGYFIGTYGVYGSGTGYGLYGQTSGNSYGVYGYAPASGAIGVRGDGASNSWGGYFTGGNGAYAQGSTGIGMYAVNQSNTTWAGEFIGGYGVLGQANCSGCYGVEGTNGTYYGIMGYSSYTIYGNGYGYLSGTLSQGSDARLKENVQDIPGNDGLSAILKLRPITYNWKDVKQNEHDGTQLGFIAQEVQRVIPSVVTKNGTTTITLKDGTKQEIPDTLGVDYARLVVPLVKAVQEQQQEIDELKAQVAALKAGQH